MSIEQTKQQYINLMADGHTHQETRDIIHQQDDTIRISGICDRWYRDPEVLQEIMETSNNRLKQVWGTMWKQIKNKAMLGNLKHAKVLIDYMKDSGEVVDKKIEFSFAKDTPAMPVQMVDNNGTETTNQ